MTPAEPVAAASPISVYCINSIAPRGRDILALSSGELPQPYRPQLDRIYSARRPGAMAPAVASRANPIHYDRAVSFSGSLVQNAIYIARRPPEWPVSADDWERAAEEKLEPGPFAYVAGGAGGEGTMRANRAAFERWRIRGRMLAGTRGRGLSFERVGRR